MTKIKVDIRRTITMTKEEVKSIIDECIERAEANKELNVLEEIKRVLTSKLIDEAHYMRFLG